MTELGRNLLVLAILGFAVGKASVVPSKISNLDIRVEDFVDNEDAHLQPGQLIEKYGYRGETHRVTTEDGYILTVHRITGPNSHSSAKGKQPVLMVHGLMGSSADWIIIGPKLAFAYILADAGYDVWLGNVRGNVYSREHNNYTTNDKQFWQFSWHEIAIRDLPAMIDYVLEKTDKKDLVYVGHSQGTTDFWVMAAERPEYQDKVKAMFALAPVAYLTHVRSPFYHVLSKYSKDIQKLLSFLGHYEFRPTNEFLKEVVTLACDDDSWTQPLCTNVMFLIGGFGSDQINKTMLPAILGHVPAGASVKQVVHYAQVLTADKFQQYDHGMVGNLIKYKQIEPPTYDLSKIKVPVYLHYSSNDWLSDPRDVDRLHKELGNPIGMFLVPHELFGHLDFIWGKDTKTLLIDDIIVLMEKYRS